MLFQAGRSIAYGELRMPSWGRVPHSPNTNSLVASRGKKGETEKNESPNRSGHVAVLWKPIKQSKVWPWLISVWGMKASITYCQQRNWKGVAAAASPTKDAGSSKL